MRYFAFVLLSLFLVSTLQAITINVPADEPTIQDGIDVAVNGDTVLVAPGTYVENIDFLGKAITLKSEEGPEVTIIDGNRTGSVVTFASGEGATSVLNGFTLINGDADHGGGIYCESSSPTIINNVVAANSAGSSGGGIYCKTQASPTISNNLIALNSAGSHGGGIRCYDHANPIISSTTITGNSAPYGAGIACWISFTTISNCVLWGDSPDEIHVNLSSPIVTYSDVAGGWTGEGNLDADPLFVDPASHDYHLQQDPPQPGVVNPCVDTGDPSSLMMLGSTRTDGVQDTNIVDLGYHYPLPEGQNVPPFAGFDWAPEIPQPNELIFFDASTSYDLDGTIVLYEWDWNNDGTYDESDVVPTTTHSWSANGIYPITLRVCDDDDDCGTMTRSVVMVQTIYVPDDFATIQQAIEASADGHTIVVRAGDYVENINFSGKAITLRSEQGPEVTIIDGSQANSVVRFVNAEGLASILSGFTLTNGLALLGGGIYCKSASPTIDNNIISGNSATANGGGIYSDASSSPAIIGNFITANSAYQNGGGIVSRSSTQTISDNTITGNSAGQKGGGIQCNSSNATITNNVISGNSAVAGSYANGGGGIHCDYGSPTITNNLITENEASNGGGIHFYNSSATISNCTITRNTATSGGGVYSTESANPQVLNSILWGNTASSGAQITIYGYLDWDEWFHPSELSLSYSDVEGGQSAVYNSSYSSDLHWDEGMIVVDPMFIDPDSSDYHVDICSPVINKGDPDYNLVLGEKDMDGEVRVMNGRLDMGADEVLIVDRNRNDINDNCEGILIFEPESFDSTRIIDLGDIIR